MADVQLIDKSYIVPQYISASRYENLRTDEDTIVYESFINNVILEKQSLVLDAARAGGYDVQAILDSPDKIILHVIALLVVYQLFYRKESVPNIVKAANDWVLNEFLADLRKGDIVLSDGGGGEETTTFDDETLFTRSREEAMFNLEKIEAVFPTPTGKKFL